MAGIQLITSSLSERRIEPNETATFALIVRNTFEEVGVTNVKITITFTPPGTISVSKIGGDSPARILNPFMEGKYVVEIKTSNAPPAEYKMDVRFDYDIVVPESLPKFSQESRPLVVVHD